MNIYKQERLVLLIDGANLYATARSLGFDVDFKKLRAHFASKGQLIRALFYTTLAEHSEQTSIRPLTDWLSYNGYAMVTKPAREVVDGSGRRFFRGNMAVEIAVHAMLLANEYDHVVLFSGSGDFRALVEALQMQGKRVTVVSTLQARQSVVADDLRRQADEFVDLAHLTAHIARDPIERPTPAAGAHADEEDLHVDVGGVELGAADEANAEADLEAAGGTAIVEDMRPARARVVKPKVAKKTARPRTPRRVVD